MGVGIRGVSTITVFLHLSINFTVNVYVVIVIEVGKYANHATTFKVYEPSNASLNVSIVGFIVA